MDPKEIDERLEVMSFFRENPDVEVQEVYFNELQIANFEYIFKKFDRNDSNTILTEDLDSVLRACGMNPSFKKANEICEWFVVNEILDLNFEQFIRLLKKSWHGQSQEELKSAFDVFDPSDNGFFTIEQLKNLMMNYGEAIDEDDFKEILKLVDVHPDGTINTQVLSTSLKETLQLSGGGTSTNLKDATSLRDSRIMRSRRSAKLQSNDKLKGGYGYGGYAGYDDYYGYNYGYGYNDYYYCDPYDYYCDSYYYYKRR
ncbi:unnamed protein product [Brachionus calyciflorus]|uniref:EF-hand domain-containing protein n=1 Tax=Brachionus calyciflorus TaxID=104777 RepID=A0A813U1N2_9BILA|nr:unnamed protein product [Brachionus calyciflorus]